MIEANSPAPNSESIANLTAQNLDRLTSIVARVVQDNIAPPAQPPTVKAPPSPPVGSGRTVDQLPWFDRPEPAPKTSAPDPFSTRRLDVSTQGVFGPEKPIEDDLSSPEKALFDTPFVPEKRADASRHMSTIDDRHMPKISEPVESIRDRAGSGESEKKVFPETLTPIDLQPKNNVTHEPIEDTAQKMPESAKSADLQPKMPEIAQPKISESIEDIWVTAQKTPDPEPISEKPPESEERLQPKTELTEDGLEDTDEKAEEEAEAEESDHLERETPEAGSDEETALDVGADVGDLFGMDKTSGAWRPVKFCRKADRPLVTVEGTKLSPSGGGFVQRYQTSLGGAYVQFFTRDAITRLENEILTPADRRRLKPQARKGKADARKPKAK